MTLFSNCLYCIQYNRGDNRNRTLLLPKNNAEWRILHTDRTCASTFASTNNGELPAAAPVISYPNQYNIYPLYIQ